MNWLLNAATLLGVVLLLWRTRKIMANMADLTAKVAELTTVEQSAVALLDGLSQQLKDAKGDPVAIQAVIDSLDAGKTDLAAAVSRNTPAA